MLNPIEEAKKFAELKKMCREMKVPAPPEIFIRMQVHDKNGAPVRDNRERGHSWTRNYWNYLFSRVQTLLGTIVNFCSRENVGKDYWGIDTASRHTSARQATEAYRYGFANNSANATYGIVAGTLDTAFRCRTDCSCCYYCSRNRSRTIFTYLNDGSISTIYRRNKNMEKHHKETSMNNNPQVVLQLRK